MFDERLQRTHVHLLKLEFANERIELLQMHGIVGDALLVRVLCQELRGGRTERTTRTQTVQLCFANLNYSLGKLLLRLRDVACSSAFANADSPETDRYIFTRHSRIRERRRIHHSRRQDAKRCGDYRIIADADLRISSMDPRIQW